MGFIRGTARRLVGRLGTLAGDRGETLATYDKLGYLPVLFWPRSFNEKIVRRKIGPVRPLWAEYSDKVAVREHVAARLGDSFLNPVYQVTDLPDAINFPALPQSFVVKASHGSGWTLIVNDKHEASTDGIRAQCRKWLEATYGVTTHEQWYSSIPPRILIERLMVDRVHGVPLDFKCWVFHGRVEFIQVDFGRFTSHTRTIYNRDWRREDWSVGYPPGPDLDRPRQLEQLIEAAECLAVDSEFVRVDLYAPDDEFVVFGELTFAPGAGWEAFLPDRRADFRVGSYW